MACKEGQFDVVEQMVNDQFKTFSINKYSHLENPVQFSTLITHL